MTPALRLLVPGAELLPARAVHAFGAVERVRFTEEGASVALSCAAGAPAAGIILRLNGTAAAGARMDVAIEAKADADFGVRVLVDEAATPAPPTRFLPAGANPSVRLALPPSGMVHLALTFDVAQMRFA